jgi:hypothetical protein
MFRFQITYNIQRERTYRVVGSNSGLPTSACNLRIGALPSLDRAATGLPLVPEPARFPECGDFDLAYALQYDGYWIGLGRSDFYIPT